jgi:hypothetical protein
LTRVSLIRYTLIRRMDMDIKISVSCLGRPDVDVKDVSEAWALIKSYGGRLDVFDAWHTIEHFGWLCDISAADWYHLDGRFGGRVVQTKNPRKK